MASTVIVGLGTFGLAIGRRISTVTSEEVVGVEADPRRRVVWEALVGKPAYSQVDEIQWRGVLRALIVVRTEAQVDTVFGQILARLPADPVGYVHVYIVSTVSEAFARRLGNHTTAAVKLVEFPLTGGEVAALDGTLVAMAVGLQDDAERAFMRRTIASRIVDFLHYGDAALAKLLSNATIAYQAATINTVLRLGAVHGIDPRALLDVISNGAASSYISKIIRHYNDTLLSKDLDLLKAAVGPLPEIDIDRVSEYFESVRKLLL